MSFQQGHLGVDAPTLNSLVSDEVYKFLKAREKYLLQVDEKNRGLSPRYQVIPVTLQSCVSKETLLQIKLMVLKKNIQDEVTEEELMEYLESVTPRGLKITGLADLKEVLEAEIRDPGPPLSPMDRMETMWAGVMKVMVKYNLYEDLQRKECLKLLRSVIQEAMNHKRMKQRLELLTRWGPEAREAKSSLSGLHDAVMNHAAKQMEEDASRKIVLRKSGRGERHRGESPKQPKSTEEEKKIRFGRLYLPPEQRRHRAVLGKPFRQKKREYDFSGKCFGCGEQGHKKRDCRKKRKLDEFRRHKLRRMSGHGNPRCVEDVILNSVFKGTACLDSGATESFVSLKMAKESGATLSEFGKPHQVS